MRPFLDTRRDVIAYDERALRFVVSEAWRVATVSLPEINPYLAKYGDSVNEAMTQWRNYLLGQRTDPGPRNHYLLLLSNTNVDAGSMSPSAFDWYMMRGVDSSYVVGDAELFTYTKLPGIALFSAIEPHEIALLSGNQIGPAGQTTGIVPLPEPLKDFVQQRAEDAIADVNWP
jgi:hypothetical protein